MLVQVISKLKCTNRVQIYWRLVLPRVHIVSNAYHMESILQVKFCRWKLLQLFWTHQALWIPKTTVRLGKIVQEHDKRLRKVFLKVGESGLKLNKTKCQIRKQSIVFLGHIISPEGIKIDPSKTEAITKMPLPRSVNELQRFLGMVNYLGKFIPNLAEHTTPL